MPLISLLWQLTRRLRPRKQHVANGLFLSYQLKPHSKTNYNPAPGTAPQGNSRNPDDDDWWLQGIPGTWYGIVSLLWPWCVMCQTWGHSPGLCYRYLKEAEALNPSYLFFFSFPTTLLFLFLWCSQSRPVCEHSLNGSQLRDFSEDLSLTLSALVQLLVSSLPKGPMS